jgi:hypothetical protein
MKSTPISNSVSKTDKVDVNPDWETRRGKRSEAGSNMARRISAKY